MAADRTGLGQPPEGTDHDALSIHLEMTTERAAAFTPTKSVSAKREQSPGDPGVELLRNRPHMIAGGHEHPLAIAQRLSGRTTPKTEAAAK